MKRHLACREKERPRGTPVPCGSKVLTRRDFPSLGEGTTLFGSPDPERRGLLWRTQKEGPYLAVSDFRLDLSPYCEEEESPQAAGRAGRGRRTTGS